MEGERRERIDVIILYYKKYKKTKNKIRKKFPENLSSSVVFNITMLQIFICLSNNDFPISNILASCMNS